MTATYHPTEDEVKERSEKLARRILEGETDHIAWIREEFKCCRSTAFDYMNRARKLVAENTDMRLEAGRAIERYHTLFQALVKKGELGQARRVNDSLCKMLGLNKPDQVTFTGTVEPIKVYLPDNGRDSKPKED